MPRAVPRNIDRPNRNAEYAASCMLSYYGTMFITGNPFLAITLTMISVYLTYKLTLNKPEGNVYRIVYKRMGLGRMLPPPRRVKRFEI